MPIINAKYAGRCYSCGEEYKIGDRVFWEKGDAPVCLGCHEEETTNAASPIKPVQKGVTARFNPDHLKLVALRIAATEALEVLENHSSVDVHEHCEHAIKLLRLAIEASNK